VFALLPTWALYFTAYDYFKKKLKSSSTGEKSAALSHAHLLATGLGWPLAVRV
jgi:hypothetical protein